MLRCGNYPIGGHLPASLIVPELGDASTMIHCYIDESGNTGGNLFDSTQPNFYTGAVIAAFDFDKRYPALLRDIAKSCGQDDFHANALGMERLRPHLPALQSLIKREKIRFFIGRVEKRHLILAKFIDVFMDPAENRAAPWHIYSTLHMRFLMLFNLNSIISEEARKEFWSALMDPNEASATQSLKRSIALVQSALLACPERRTREIIGEAVAWAHDNCEALNYFSKSKRHRIPHFPNLVAFPEMLAAFDNVAAHNGLDVAEIKHDRQCEVEAVLRDWHRLFANAGDEELNIFGEVRKLRAVPHSSFVIASSKDSAGIQLIDLVLWLERIRVEGGPVPPEAKAFIERVERNAEFFDMSMAYTKKRCLELNRQICDVPFGPQEEARGRAWLADIEERRQASMREYANAKSARP